MRAGQLTRDDCGKRISSATCTSNTPPENIEALCRPCHIEEHRTRREQG